MATRTIGENKTFKSTNDLSAKQFFIVKQDTADTAIVLAAAATDFILGTLENKPKAGENASVFMRHANGTGKVILGGSVNRGDHLTADSAGKAVATTTGGDEMLGRALSGGSAGDIIEYEPMQGKYRTS